MALCHSLAMSQPPKEASCRSDINPITKEPAINTLPAEIMQMIFKQLTTSERVPLASTCRRFRAFDFDLGRRTFDTIDIDWASILFLIMDNCENQHITGRYCKMESRICSSNTVYYKKAKTNAINVKYAKKDHNQEDHQLISNILATVEYRELNVDFYCDQDATENFLSTLVNNRNLSDARLVICWRSDSSSQNVVTQARELIMQLPSIDHFTMHWFDHYRSNRHVVVDECLIDDAALLHIASYTNHALLSNGDCTTIGILNAFETICQSSCDKKTLTLCVRIFVLEELFSQTDLIFEKEMMAPERDIFGISIDLGLRCLIDRKRRAVLIETDFTHVSGYRQIKMGKIDEKEFIKYEDMNWYWTLCGISRSSESKFLSKKFLLH